MKYFKYAILVVILSLSGWALLPPRDTAKAGGLGTNPSRNKNDAGVKYLLRFNPGPRYLPNVVPENSTRGIEGIAKVGEAFEKLFPDTRIEFIGVPGDVREWLVTQLSSGQAPDVIHSNVENVWQDIQKTPPWYLKLDEYLDAPNPFVPKGQPGSVRWWDMFKYEVPTRGTMAPDEHMYCIVLDMIETGIYYNKTLFKRLGLSEPKTWSEFLQLQQKIRDAGYTPLLVDRVCLSDWGIDLTFEQLYGELRDVLDLDYNPTRGEYLHGYLDWDEIIFLHDKGFFTPQDPRWVEMWRILKAWRPYMSRDLNPNGIDFVKEFVTERGAMYWSHSMIVPRLVKDPNLAFEWGIFYLPPIPQSYSRFARGQDQCVIGGSGTQYSVTNKAWSDTGDPKTSERLKRVIAFLQFLTTPENCDMVVNEQIALLPNIKGVEPHAELMPFHNFLQRPYSMTKWYYTLDDQWNQALMRMLELYLNDGVSEQELVDLLERDFQRTSRRMIERKSLDMSRFEKVWAERAALRRKFSELPHAAN